MRGSIVEGGGRANKNKKMQDIEYIRQPSMKMKTSTDIFFTFEHVFQ
jgi:hypothetical protein